MKLKLGIQVPGLKSSFRASLLVPEVTCKLLVTCLSSPCTISAAVKSQPHDTEHCKEGRKMLITAVLERGFCLKTVVLVEAFSVMLLSLSVLK